MNTVCTPDVNVHVICTKRMYIFTYVPSTMSRKQKMIRISIFCDADSMGFMYNVRKCTSANCVFS